MATLSRSKALAPRFNPWRQAWQVQHRGLYIGTNARTDSPLYFDPKWLSTGLHVIGPPGSGKTRLLLHLVELLSYVPRASVVVVNGKGEFGRQCRDWVIAQGQTKRLVWFDPADQERIIGYNPLKPNGLPPTVQAKAVREALLAAWGQQRIDETPQLARHLLMVLQAARELELTLVEACELLRGGLGIRQSLLPQLRDGPLRDALLYFDSLREQRQDELAASTLARLEAFINDPMIRRILTQQRRSLDLGEVLSNHKILILNLEQYKPLRPTDVRLLGRLFLNDLIAHVFEREASHRSPVFLIVDEVQLFLSEDLAQAFELGRELGLRTVIAHQFLRQLADDDPAGRLLAAVKNCARSRAVFGGNWAADLRELVEDLFIDQYDPWALKDELTNLELEPIETTRVSRTRSHSHSQGRGLAMPTSETIGESEAESHGESAGLTLGVQVGELEAETHGKSQGRSRAIGSAQTKSRAWAHTEGFGHSQIHTESQGSGMHAGEGLGETILPNGEIITSGHDTTGMSGMHAAADGEVESESQSFTEIVSLADSHSVTAGVQETDTESHTTGQSKGLSLSREQGTSESETTTRSRNVSRGVTPSVSKEEGWSESETIQPFHEYRKRRVPSSRTYLSEQEQMTQALQAIKAQPTGHFTLKVPTSPAIFMRAPFVRARRISTKALKSALQRIFTANPYYSTVDEIEAEERARNARLVNALPPAPAFKPADVWMESGPQSWTPRSVTGKGAKTTRGRRDSKPKKPSAPQD